jgi:multidrug efflux pump subunit AcrA (membrane-fusion protein)
VVKRLSTLLRRPRNAIVILIVAVAAVSGFFVSVGRGSAPDVPMSTVARGDFIDRLEIRGEIRPLKSVVLSSPLQSGELQIIKLVKSGTLVKSGDVLVQFDGSTLQRTIQEKQSELRQAEAEIEQTRAQAKITEEQNATALMKAQYDLQRAKLDVQKGDTIPRIQLEQAKLMVGEFEQKLKELQAKITSDKTGAEATVAGKRRKREKAMTDLERAQRGLEKLELKAPAAGMVNVLPNPRTGAFFGGGEQEFREGDRAWAGANVLELPDLSSVHLEARLDESDRGRLNPGQEALVRIEAVPGKDFKARIDKISLLARVDFSSGWPPPKNFDLGLVLLDGDPRIRPGMTAVARIATERIPDVVLVPSESVFQKDGSPIVYKLDGSMFREQRIQISRRGKEQAVVTVGVAPGDRIATRRPGAEMIRRQQ